MTTEVNFQEAAHSPQNILNRIDNFINDLVVPGLDIDIEKKPDINLAEIENLDNVELSRYLTMFGSFRAYLDIQLSNIESKKTVFTSNFEEGFSRAIFLLEKRYEKENKKKPTKDSLRGEALSMFPLLRKTRHESIEYEGMYIRIKGIRDAYAALYSSLSRVAALRLSKNEG